MLNVVAGVQVFLRSTKNLLSYEFIILNIQNHTILVLTYSMLGFLRLRFSIEKISKCSWWSCTLKAGPVTVCCHFVGSWISPVKISQANQIGWVGFIQWTTERWCSHLTIIELIVFTAKGLWSHVFSCFVWNTPQGNSTGCTWPPVENPMSNHRL